MQNYFFEEFFCFYYCFYFVYFWGGVWRGIFSKSSQTTISNILLRSSINFKLCMMLTRHVLVAVYTFTTSNHSITESFREFSYFLQALFLLSAFKIMLICLFILVFKCHLQSDQNCVCVLYVYILISNRCCFQGMLLWYSC